MHEEKERIKRIEERKTKIEQVGKRERERKRGSDGVKAEHGIRVEASVSFGRSCAPV